MLTFFIDHCAIRKNKEKKKIKEKVVKDSFLLVKISKNGG